MKEFGGIVLLILAGCCVVSAIYLEAQKGGNAESVTPILEAFGLCLFVGGCILMKRPIQPKE